MSNAPNDHHWLEARLNFIAQSGFAVSVIPDDQLTMAGGALVAISLEGETFELFVSDEYRDLERDVPALSLEVVKRACEEYLDHANSQDWARAEGIPPRCQLLLRLRWDADRRTAAQILKLVDPIADQINDLDWQLNSGRAQILRGM